MEFNFDASFEKHFENARNRFEEELTKFVKENPDATAQSAIEEALPLSVQLSVRTIKSVLEDYHAELMEYLKTNR